MSPGGGKNDMLDEHEYINIHFFFELISGRYRGNSNFKRQLSTPSRVI
jgi:hypothetical protein